MDDQQRKRNHDKIKKLLGENPPTPEMLERITDAAKAIEEPIKEAMSIFEQASKTFANSKTWDAVKYVYQNLARLSEFARLTEIHELEPYLEVELKKPEYGGKSIHELYIEQETTEEGTYKEDCLYWRAINAARSAHEQEIKELEPYIAKELQKPEYEGKSIDDLFDIAEADEEGIISENSLFAKVMAAARAEMIAERRNQLPQVKEHKLQKSYFALDKVNAGIWNLISNEVRAAEIDFTPEGKRRKYLSNPLITTIIFDFKELEKSFPTIEKRLTQYDKRVYFAAGSLWNEGLHIMTYQQIYYAMGYKGRIGGADIEKIENSLNKMSSLHISMSNEKEAKELKGYPLFEYHSVLLPSERIKVVTSGNETMAAVHLFREPPLLTFARERKNITTVDTKLLQSPFNKTDANLRIEDYLIRRIGRAKNNKKNKSEAILLKTLYDNVNITDGKQRKRSLEKIKDYLEFYKSQLFIKGYTMETDKIIVRL